ncbi:Ankyrin-3 [Metarhizium brunneum]|uniref:Ankyrin-3 n=1 Tax=Metarhizium brunneum TaxID=500148 RepID=A0A7D5US88_9HYPO|nr:Ankyrin-3 [Metarhizium brunneum]
MEEEEKKKTKAPIERLPPELLLNIGEWFDDRRSLNTLVRTSLVFYTALNAHLYKLNIRNDPPSASCLFWAAQVGRLGTFRVAHRFGADLNVKRETKREPPSPLHTAIKNLHPEIVEYILQNGGHVHSPPWIGKAKRYPLGIALTARNLRHDASCVRKNQIILDMLIRHGANMVDDGEPALPHAAAMNKNRVVHLLLQQPTHGHTELLHYLLNQPGINIHAQSTDALGFAVVNGHVDAVRLLVMWHGLTPDAAFELRKTAFLRALETGQASICEFLITLPGINGALSLPRNCTALHWAARSENVDCVPVLLDKSSFHLGAVDDDGHTALHCLAMTLNSKGRTTRAEVVRMLVDRGAEVNPVSLMGYTPLHFAIARNNFDVATQLLHQEADPTIGAESDTGDYIWTLLHESLLGNSWVPWNYEPRIRMLQALIQHDYANLNKESRVTSAEMRRTKDAPFDGTPLLFAVLYDSEPGTIKMLIKAGARVDSVAMKRETAAPNSFHSHSILQALLSSHLRPNYPVSYKDTNVSVSVEDVRHIKTRLEILLSNGARIDNEHGPQSVLEYACEVQLAGYPALLGALFEMAHPVNVSSGHVQSLIHSYSGVAAEEYPPKFDLAAALQKWMDVWLIPEGRRMQLL